MRSLLILLLRGSKLDVAARSIWVSSRYLTRLILPPLKGLGLGFGTGMEAREVVRRSNFQGKITAIDISADLVERGKGLAEQERFEDRIKWLVGDAEELRLPDGHFDLVLAHTLVSHVPDPKRVVQQAARVVRPGGTVVIFDGDYATLTFGTDREMDEKIITGVIANPRVMRGMPSFWRGRPKAGGQSRLGAHRDRPADFFLDP